MPCNAHNHPPDCNCGWGGVFYPTAEGYTYGPGYWSKVGSYTNPNAKCPVCGAAVFFYRSPDNGRVFFDHPGPPWPKHPCTNRESVKERTAFGSLGQQQNGWFPFPCKFIFPISPQVAALVNTQDRVLYVPYDASELELESPVWARRIDQHRKQYEVSLLVMKGGVTKAVRIRAHVRLEALNQVLAKDASSQGEPAQESTEAALNSDKAHASLSVRVAAHRARPQTKALRPLLKLKKLSSEDAQESATPEVPEAPEPMKLTKSQVAKRKTARRSQESSGSEARRSVSQSRAQPTLMELAFSRLAEADGEARRLLNTLGKRT